MEQQLEKANENAQNAQQEFQRIQNELMNLERVNIILQYNF